MPTPPPIPKYFLSGPETDPSQLLRLRDSIYAADMVIAAVGWLDFFSWLKDNPSDLGHICISLNLARRPADVMITLFTAMGLTEKRQGAYHLSHVAEEHLAKASFWNLGPYLASLKERPMCKELFAVLKTGKPAGWSSAQNEKAWAAAMESEDFAEDFTTAMDSRGAYLGPMMAESMDLTGYGTLMDIAGGSGIYSVALVAHNPQMTAVILEKPPVDKVAEYAISRKGLSERISVISGDMFESLPQGFDVHLFSNVLHDWGEESVAHLLHNSFDALPSGGMVMIHDAHLNEEKTGPLAVAEYSVLLMHSTEGRCYSVSELWEILEGIGFKDMEVIPTKAWRSVITAKKPQ